MSDLEFLGKVDTEPLERALDLRQYLNFVWRNWVFIASVTVFAFLVAVIYLVHATPLYTATTQVLLVQPENAPALSGVDDRRSGFSYSNIENQFAILQSDSLLRRVVVKELLTSPTVNELQPARSSIRRKGLSTMA